MGAMKNLGTLHLGTHCLECPKAERPLLLVAHRGDPRHARENTLASFRQAAARGAGSVEADARRTSDGIWVVFHDATLHRITGCSGRLARTPWGRLKKLEVQIPQVSELVRWCRAGGLQLFLDVKVDRAEPDLLALLRRSGWLHRIRILAGTIPSLRRWRRLLPADHPLYWVTGFRDSLTAARVRTARGLHLTGLVAHKGRVHAAAIEEIRRAGMELFVWTVRTASEVRFYARLGVDGMMSEVWPPPSISSLKRSA